MSFSSLQVVRQLSVDAAENNEGIFLVRDQANNRLLIEKRFKLFDIWNGFAQREIDILFQLRGHRNITSIEGYYLHDGTPDDTKGSVWLEYCDQGTLEDSINQHDDEDRKIPEPCIWYVFLQLAEAVRYCQMGPFNAPCPQWDTIFHLDLNPSNVLLEGEVEHRFGKFPRVLLADFGCSMRLSTQMENARLLEENPEADVPLPFTCDWQNAEYSPPETPSFNLRSDIYQIGLVIYCMIVTDSAISPNTDLVQGLWSEGDVYTAPLLRLVNACLENEPARRPDIIQLIQMIVSQGPNA
ncbi:kinase-like protein [Periconia macrospinosa]|uniref:non-specific serine/threonine protein kinase n=1 Tax=Periconia macrospinosa TaxID=97972 RepID=A0A2V1DN70_9PLEO|nr:kinase-like protein [Periconia macrospinosa]